MLGSLRLRRFLARHRNELGEPVATYRNLPNAVAVIGALVIWALVAALVLADSNLADTTRIVLIAVTVALVLVTFALVSAEVLVVCERGIVVGPAGCFALRSSCDTTRSPSDPLLR